MKPREWSSVHGSLGNRGRERCPRGYVRRFGAGRAATRAIRALAQRTADQHLGLRCVATSRTSDELARALGLRMREIGSVDYLFDGADEVGKSLRMLKGRGGAMTREKTVAHAWARRVYLVQAIKLVARLGETGPLPIEAMGFDLTAVRCALLTLGLGGALRLNADRTLYETDSGNPIIDAPLPREVDVTQLSAVLDGTPGVVVHGLFLTQADVVLIEDEKGQVSERVRRTRP